jgi:hypothetical protein
MACQELNGIYSRYKLKINKSISSVETTVPGEKTLQAK